MVQVNNHLKQIQDQCFSLFFSDNSLSNPRHPVFHLLRCGSWTPPKKNPEKHQNSEGMTG